MFEHDPAHELDRLRRADEAVVGISGIRAADVIDLDHVHGGADEMPAKCGTECGCAAYLYEESGKGRPAQGNAAAYMTTTTREGQPV